jgi:acyl phosphate:glycerol-3-phosphate acyltransferase
MAWLGGTLAAFLLGSLPWGLWLGRWTRGIDVRLMGSGNLGATNVYRVLGPRLGILVLLLDAGKGTCAVLLCRTWTGSPVWGGLLGMAAAVLGHSFTPWAGFRGGKGVAAAAGAWSALAPLPLACTLGVWTLVFILARIVSLGSIIAAAALPVAVGLLVHRAGGPWTDPLFLFALLTCLLILARHRSNIRRLLQGKEKPLNLRRGGPEGSA